MSEQSSLSQQPPIFNIIEIISLIGNYQLNERKIPEENSHASHAKVVKLLGKEGLEKLYQNCPDKTSRDKRFKFIQLLQKILAQSSKPNPIGTNRINLVDLLGKDGIALYKEALQEERNSKNFRDAVFLESTKTYQTKTKWNKQMILWIAGPSSSGKSFATNAVINEMIGTMDHNTDPLSDSNQENHIVTIDGGISREISQIRQLVLQAALQLGYTGIEDLETHTGKIKLKNEINDAAIADNNPALLSLAIPCTFINHHTILT